MHTPTIVRHITVFGASRQSLSRTLDPQSSLSLFSAATAGNLYQAPPLLTDTSNLDRSIVYTISTWRHKSVFASNTIDFNDRWSLLAGARYVDYANLNECQRRAAALEEPPGRTRREDRPGALGQRSGPRSARS